MNKIDVNRGVTIRKAVRFDEKNPKRFETIYGGLEVYMYKDQPGVYYDAHGNKVNEKLAGIAGFPTSKLANERKRKERLDAFKDQVDKELALLSEDDPVVLAERDDWKIVQAPGGRARIMTLDGDYVTPLPITKKEAFQLLDLTYPAKGGKNTKPADDDGTSEDKPAAKSGEDKPEQKTRPIKKEE